MRFIEEIKILRNAKGFSLIEVVVVMGLMGVMFFFVNRMMQVSSETIAYQEFSLTKNEIQMELMNYKMNMLNECSCMLQGQTFAPGSMPALFTIPASGITAMSFTDPNDCSTGTIVRTLVRKDQIVNKATIKDIVLNITNGSGNNWTGNFEVTLETNRKVLGPPVRTIKTHVDFITQDVAGVKEIQRCVVGSQTASTPGSIDVSGDGVGDSMTPAHSTTQAINFPNVPATAKAVILAYKIGNPGSGDREERYCRISPSNVYIGHESHGDGRSRMIAGTAIVPVDVGQTIWCNNEDSNGYLRVMGVIY